MKIILNVRNVLLSWSSNFRWCRNYR